MYDEAARDSVETACRSDEALYQRGTVSRRRVAVMKLCTSEGQCR